MTIEEMKSRKKELGYSYRKLSELSGVPLGTVQKVLGGKTPTPRYNTLHALEQVLRRPARQVMIREENAVYQVQEQSAAHSAAVSCPGARTEILYGTLYQYPPSVIGDRRMAGLLYRAVMDQLDGEPQTYAVVLSPVLDLSDGVSRTVTVPDLCVAKPPVKYGDLTDGSTVYMAADFVAGQASVESRYLKTGCYAGAGLREYWRIDSALRQVEVYSFLKETVHTVYSFADVIPLQIPSGTCMVDFAEICKGIA